MKALGNILLCVVVIVAGGLIYQYLSSQSLDRRVGNSERRLEVVSEESQAHQKSLEAQKKELETHKESIAGQTKEISELWKRVQAAEGRLTDLARSGDADRASLARLRAEIDELKGKSAEEDARRRQLEELGRELKKSLQRDAELERRLAAIERQLGIERPIP
jgi:predicted RNase H-like nuclease (RuvC/YqgF family)